MIIIIIFDLNHIIAIILNEKQKESEIAQNVFKNAYGTNFSR